MGIEDEGAGWGRQLLIGVGALVGVAVLIGAVVGVLALGAADVVGLGGSAGSGPSEQPSLYMPPLTPTVRPTEATGPDASGSSNPSQPEESTTSKPNRPSPKIALSASPTIVSSSERIDLTGVYPSGEGVTLQVQRFEGSWVDFPTTATVIDGIFATYVVSGHTGRNRFRVVDESSGRASNAATVTIR